MLRIKILFLLQFLIFISSAQSGSFSIKGNYLAPNGTSIFLKYTYRDTTIIDSTKLINNTFLFKEKVLNPTLAYVGNDLNIIDFMPYFIVTKDNSLSMQLFGNSFDKIKVKGSNWNDQLNQYRVFYASVDSVYQSKIQKLDFEKDDSLIQIYSREKKEKLVDYSTDFIAHHPDSYTSVFLISNIIDVNELLADSVFKLLTPDIQNSTYGKQREFAINYKGRSAVGKIAPDFILNDSSGVAHSLKDVKGKYIFVDFWASWCGPCRAEIPNVVKAYNTFKDKGLDIIGVSVDDGFHIYAWKDAIINDQSSWLQLIDDKKANVADAYGVSYIPANVLINPEGVIVAKNIKGPYLWEILKKYVK